MIKIAIIVIAIILLSFAALLFAAIRQADKDMVKRSKESRMAREKHDAVMVEIYEAMIAKIDLKAKGV